MMFLFKKILKLPIDIFFLFPLIIYKIIGDHKDRYFYSSVKFLFLWARYSVYDYYVLKNKRIFFCAHRKYSLKVVVPQMNSIYWGILIRIMNDNTFFIKEIDNPINAKKDFFSKYIISDYIPEEGDDKYISVVILYKEKDEIEKYYNLQNQKDSLILTISSAHNKPYFDPFIVVVERKEPKKK